MLAEKIQLAIAKNQEAEVDEYQSPRSPQFKPLAQFNVDQPIAVDRLKRLIVK